ncbi:glycoside hydrolase 5 family protein [Mangrovibacterium diazotrophicum]|uniref:Cellulase (Glycosyl hydrolase family 5) n=1 Tax=Mangrovibacterium diazotrophicum TaxID=1261403 RepID=A0A419WAD2_9BACT|nr:hypothetical protein [Mangrovibacterium diazotrophicum]RKD92428.1 hypothetical protein BC643_2800 [Mangrovibacterium diazotrophicum]
MKKILAVLCCFVFVISAVAQETASVYVDAKGVMRWSDTHREASFFGVNYTLPFAHAYRAAGYLGIDRKKAIDEDVYHFARLGFNAYRIHIWDVEVSDGEGNLLENDHLDLLDYLIAKLKERNIHVVLTAQTDFGNGYPERNQATGGFSYKYDKCDIHSNPEAIAAQERYISDLVKHVNPYTGKAYKDDPIVVGFEINNEPCHSGTKEQVRDYINGMVGAMKDAGNSKPVFYNVSHNGYVVEAYYDAGIQGTTYQWYPTGLVSGHTQKGNFLPNVDEYPIPFSNVNGFENKTKLVYEFDPADLLYSYMYPAAVRSFRTTGFQWITQFAYDPMELAAYNTEYQTHYLNLAYTPNKAISMKIAAEAARELPLNKSYGSYPADTVFGDFRVSYKEDLSELNSPTKFYYSNSTKTRPQSANSLTSTAGVGYSQVVKYSGTGAYFLDKLEDGVWRLEVMPDAVQVSDPFAKPSLEKEVVRIYWGAWDMTLNLPDLGKSFSVKEIDQNKTRNTKTESGTIEQLQPGVYLLQRKGVKAVKEWDATTKWNGIRVGEFVAPKPSTINFTVRHLAAKVAEAGKPLTIEAVVAGNQFPDSVLIYTDKVSFWNSNNPYYKMARVGGYNYRVEVPGEDVRGTAFNYNIVVFRDGQKQTYPANVDRSPLDWDYTAAQFYNTPIVEVQKPIELFAVKDDSDGLQTYMLPEWGSLKSRVVAHSPTETNTVHFSFKLDNEQPELYLRKYIADEIVNRKDRLKSASTLCIQVKDAPAGLKAGFVTSDGFTYRADCLAAENGIVRIPLDELKQGQTALLPVAYPVFMNHYFTPEINLPFKPESIEFLELMFPGEKGEETELEIGSIWIE